MFVGKAKRKHLNQEACNELGSTSRGAHALTQPPVVKQGRSKQDPNRGLHPKKRHKWGNVLCLFVDSHVFNTRVGANTLYTLNLVPFVYASGHPAAKQSHIGDFFCASSPHKPAQASSSTHANWFAEVVNEEKDDDDDDGSDEDDVSLLAAPSVPECGANEEEWDEEEEFDDVSLLAAVMMPVPQAEEEKIDYLEGITSEMFGGDEFDNYTDQDQTKEEDVEALPDAHYGLLGSSRVLLKPQGCIDDLPEEVLRQILSLLPASDLYRNAILVCQRWKSITQDAKVTEILCNCYMVK